MKLLIITGIYPPTPGGPATYVKLLEDELPSKGFEVSVITFDSVRHLPKGIRHAVFLIKILNAGRKSDLWYVQDPVSVGYPTYLASKILRKKYVLKMVGDYAWEQGRQRFGVEDLLDDFVQKNSYVKAVKKLKVIQTKVAKSAEKVVVPSKYLKKIVEAWGVAADKITVVYNAFNGAYVESSKQTLRSELGIAENKKVIVCVARLVPWKGIDTVINLIPKITKEIGDVQFVVIGDGPEKERLKKIVKEKELEEHVHILGALERGDVYRYIKLSNVFVLNTAYEGLSHVLLEATALHVPIVTTNVGGNPELIEDGKNGTLVSYNNEEEILSALLSILNKQDSPKDLTNVNTIPAHFERDYMLEHISNVLQQEV